MDLSQNASKIYCLGPFSPKPNYLKWLARVGASYMTRWKRLAFVQTQSFLP